MTDILLENMDLNDLKECAHKLASQLHPRDVIFLDGDLGAGKTQFAKFLIQAAAGEDIDVPSPTFTIVQLYDTNIGEIWHFDLYRIEDENETEAIGIEEAFSEGISLFEWPDRLGTYAPKSRLEIRISINPDETRTLKIDRIGDNWQKRDLTLKG